MTNQEAKEILLQIMYDGEYPLGTTEAINMAVEALDIENGHAADKIYNLGLKQGTLGTLNKIVDMYNNDPNISSRDLVKRAVDDTIIRY